MPAFATNLTRRSLRSRTADYLRLNNPPAGSRGSDSTRPHRNAHSPLFRPGDSVLESGIYEVVHDAQHRAAHEVVMITNDHFPVCDTCADKVRFRLVRTAPYIFTDEDFEEEEK